MCSLVAVSTNYDELDEERRGTGDFAQIMNADAFLNVSDAPL